MCFYTGREREKGDVSSAYNDYTAYNASRGKGPSTLEDLDL